MPTYRPIGADFIMLEPDIQMLYNRKDKGCSMTMTKTCKVDSRKAEVVKMFSEVTIQHFLLL